MSTAMGESRDGAGEDIGSEPLSAGDNGSMPDEGQPQARAKMMSLACSGACLWGSCCGGQPYTGPYRCLTMLSISQDCSHPHAHAVVVILVLGCS